MLKEVFAVLLLSFVCVRSDWLLSQPCNKAGSVANYGTYTSGSCNKVLGPATYGVCNGWQTWQSWTCPGPQADCGDISCVMGGEIQMGSCQNGLYQTCTDKKNFDINDLEWAAVAFEKYNNPGCTDNQPAQVFIAEMSACINTVYSKNSNYQSYKVDCLKNGGQAKISLFQQINCASLAKTVVTGTNNCTVLPDFAYFTPIKVQCSDLD